MIRFFVVLLFSMAWQTAARADAALWPRFSSESTDTATVIAGMLLALGFVALGFRIARRGKRVEK